MKKKQIKFKLAELFSGPGGLALGAIRSFAENKNTIYGIEPVWANDYDNGLLQRMLVAYRVQMEAEKWKTAVSYNCEPEVIERILEAVKALTK